MLQQTFLPECLLAFYGIYEGFTGKSHTVELKTVVNQVAELFGRKVSCPGWVFYGPVNGTVIVSRLHYREQQKGYKKANDG